MNPTETKSAESSNSKEKSVRKPRQPRQPKREKAAEAPSTFCMSHDNGAADFANTFNNEQEAIRESFRTGRPYFRLQKFVAKETPHAQGGLHVQGVPC